MSYGLWCGLYLVSFGLCCTVLLIYFRVDKFTFVGIKALIYGGLYLIVSYGVFGEDGTQDILKGRNNLFRNLIFFLILSFNIFPCSNFLEMLDHCNLSV